MIRFSDLVGSGVLSNVKANYDNVKGYLSPHENNVSVSHIFSYAETIYHITWFSTKLIQIYASWVCLLIDV